jgi:hypothetical protein
MFRLFPGILSGTRAAATAYLGVKALELAGYNVPGSLSTILQMNAIGNFSLSLALGTTIEMSSLAWLGFTGFRSAVSDDQSVGLKARNIAAGAAVFTARHDLGALIGFALYTLCRENNASLSSYMAVSTLGSLLFAAGVTFGAQATTFFGAHAAQGVLNLAAENMASAFTPEKGRGFGR